MPPKENPEQDLTFDKPPADSLTVTIIQADLDANLRGSLMSGSFEPFVKISYSPHDQHPVNNIRRDFRSKIAVEFKD